MTSLAYSIAKYTFGAALTGSVLALGGLWYFQRSLIYPANFPEGSRRDVPVPSQLGLPYEDVRLTTPDGVSLHAYVIPARPRGAHGPSSAEALRDMSPEQRQATFEREMQEWTKEVEGGASGDGAGYARGRPTVLLFHANAGNMGHRIPLARKFNVEFGCNVFMLSYRGYGKSEGKPSEQGIRVDVDTAIEYVKAHPLLGDTKLIAYGQSIGGAVSLYAAAHHPDAISGLILENTFLSLPALIPHLMPHIPRVLLPVLLSERWDAAAAVRLIPRRTPMLLLSGGKDELVPKEHMAGLRALRDVGAGAGAGAGEKEEARTKLVVFPLGSHNDTCMIPDYWKEIGIWLRDEMGVELA